MIFAEHTRAEGLPDLLAWFTLVAPGVVLNKDGSLLAGWAYSGPDLDSSTAEELTSQAEILNRALLALGDGWGLHAEALRLHAPAYPKEGAFPDPVTRLLDDERRSLYEARPLFETRLFLTVTYAPPPRGSSRLKGFFFDGLTKEGAQRMEAALDSPLAYFEGRLGELEDHLGGALRLSRLDDRALLTLLHTCLTGLTHTVEVPPLPDLLDYYLGSQDLYGGLAPRIGGQAVKVLSFALLPLATSPGLLDQLARLPIPFLFSTRFLPLDPSTALRVLSSYRLRWMQSRRGLRYFSDLSSPEARRAPEAVQDHDSLNMLRDIDDGRGGLRLWWVPGTMGSPSSPSSYLKRTSLGMTGPGGAVFFIQFHSVITTLGLARKREGARAPEPSSVGIDPLAKAPRGAKLLRRSESNVPQTLQKVLEDLPLPRKQLNVLFPACRSPDDHCFFPLQSPQRWPGAASPRFSSRLLAPASRMAARPGGGGTPRPSQRPASRGFRLTPSSRPVPAPLRALALVRIDSTPDYLHRLRPLCLAVRSAPFVHRRRVPHSRLVGGLYHGANPSRFPVLGGINLGEHKMSSPKSNPQPFDPEAHFGPAITPPVALRSSAGTP